MEMMTTHDVAALLAVSPQTLAIWRSKGRGPDYMKFGKVVRYERAAVESFMRNLTVTSEGD